MLDHIPAPETVLARRALPPRVTAPPAPLGPWRAFRVARRNILELIPEPAYRAPFVEGGATAPWLMVQDPDWLEYVLKTRVDIYPRSDVTRRLLRPVEGDSVFTAEGSAWRSQRRAMAPGFAHRNLAALSPIMTEAAEAAARRLAAQDGEVVDIHGEMIAVTFDVIRDTLLSGRESLDRDEVAAAVTRFIQTSGRLGLLDILNAPDWVPRPVRAWNRRTGRALDRIVDRVIAARRARGSGEPPDLLDMLIAAEDPESGRRLSAVEVRNNLVAFIVAGHETTALALSWALWLVAFDEAVQTRARDAAHAAVGETSPSADDLPALGYIRQVVEEAMRLFPPAGLLARTAKQDDRIGDHDVRKGATVMAPIYALHRHRLLWEDPDAFDPDRFAQERAASRHRFAFLPFGAGPRICVGAGFAMMEATLVLATLLARFRFALAPGPAPRPEMLITLRPTGGVRLRVERL
jgi:cytochrome P450